VDQRGQYVNLIVYRKHRLKTTDDARDAQCERASMRVIVWQWGRFGAGPRLAVSLAEGFRALGGVDSVLSLSTGAEVMHGPDGASCQLPVETYTGVAGLAWRLIQAPITVMKLSRRLRCLDPQLAVCAMPGPLDLLMILALHRFGIPAAVIVHDAEAHPGDRIPLLQMSQRALLRRADLVILLSMHVAERLRANGSLRPATPVVVASLPPLSFGAVAPLAARAGPRRLLCFGRLRAYKGLDLLAAALRSLGPLADLEVRVVGNGPESTALAALRILPGVKVENRWVPESEVNTLLNWADVVVLPYREASQSGIAPTALASGRRVIATRVGGLPEQLGDSPLATLCEPEAASLAAAIKRVMEMPRDVGGATADPRQAWRKFAAIILDGLASLVPGLAAPMRQIGLPPASVMVGVDAGRSDDRIGGDVAE
jgi:glycosyltransferase involved in cell wall biosynthesis